MQTGEQEFWKEVVKKCKRGQQEFLQLHIY